MNPRDIAGNAEEEKNPPTDQVSGSGDGGGGGGGGGDSVSNTFASLPGIASLLLTGAIITDQVKGGGGGDGGGGSDGDSGGDG